MDFTAKSAIYININLLEMSLNKYKTLSEQEQIEIPTSFPQSFLFNLKTIFQVLFLNKHTQLEKLLLEDNHTFKSSVTDAHAVIDRVNYYGDIYNVVVPHPFRTQLNNSSLSEATLSQLTKVINESPVLLFIHGLGGNLQQFDEQLIKFQELSDVVAFDLPGSGFSTYDPQHFNLTLNGFTEFVIEFLKLKGFEKRDLIIVGHSYGTQIALNLVNLLAGRVKGVALLAPPKTPFKRPFYQRVSLKLFRSLPLLFDIFRKFDRLNNIHSTSLKRLFANKEIDEYYKFKQFKFNLSTVSHNFLTHALEWEPLSQIDLLDAGKALQNNLLIIDGGEDQVTHNGGQHLKDFIGSTAEYIVIPNAGHNLTLDSYEAVNQLLSKFFKKVNPILDEAYLNELGSELIYE